MKNVDPITSGFVVDFALGTRIGVVLTDWPACPAHNLTERVNAPRL